ncbi:hypothetical protein [Spiroplasma endosymbiont of 'Nebria riversi']|uniref:hypothetical protein n=1 Tax=Spiroplasma endosymbiont of 'Nebria riversi' TaxID=2792084 RepID=UPI001C047A1C|nr:hypothetical protein [Spiroplasma endosymbiont of 'Nebria riversi']
MEQSFIKREKRASNPSQCGESCELEFVSLDNTLLIYPYAVENIGNLIFYGGISPLPSDIEERFSNYISFEIQKGVVLDKIVKFYKNNRVYGTYKRFNFDTGYLINNIVNVKFSISFKSTDYYITSFSAEMPPLPEKDKEQPLPTEITKIDGEY